MPLGSVVRNLRQGKSYTEQAARDKDELDTLGFVWICNDAECNEAILPALEVCAEVYKKGNVRRVYCSF